MSFVFHARNNTHHPYLTTLFLGKLECIYRIIWLVLPVSVRFAILPWVSIETTTWWDVTLYRLLEVYRRFIGKCSLSKLRVFILNRRPGSLKFPDRDWGSYSPLFNVNSRLFLWGYRGEGIKFTIHLHLVTRFRKNGDIPEVPAARLHGIQRNQFTFYTILF